MEIRPHQLRTTFLDVVADDWKPAFVNSIAAAVDVARTRSRCSGAVSGFGSEGLHRCIAALISAIESLRRHAA